MDVSKWISKFFTNINRKDHQLTYLAKSFARKFLIWLATFTFLWIFSFWSLLVNLVIAALAIQLSGAVYAVAWHFLPKDFISDLNEKAVFITGCDSGFGHNLAKRLDQKGLTVYAGCMFPDGEGASELKKNCSDRLRVLPLDVTSESSVQEALKFVSSSLGNKKLWAVVNNAGIGIGGEIEWSPVEICQKTLEVNAVGPYRVSRAFLPLLRKSRGRVVIVVSVLGRISLAGSGSYCMSKYAAAALADCLRREVLKFNISVHSVEPWLYSTAITNEKKIIEDLMRNWEVTPQEIKDAYGENYIQQYQNHDFNQPPDHPQLVSDCFEFQSSHKEKQLKFKTVGHKLKMIRRMIEIMILEKKQKCVFIPTNTKRPASKVYEVVDALEHAAIGKDPKLRYVPGLVGQLWTWFVHLGAEEVHNIITYFISPQGAKQQ